MANRIRLLQGLGAAATGGGSPISTALRLMSAARSMSTTGTTAQAAPAAPMSSTPGASAGTTAAAEAAAEAAAASTASPSSAGPAAADGGASTASSSSSSAAPGASPEDVAKRLLASLRSGYDSTKAKFAAGAGAGSEGGGSRGGEDGAGGGGGASTSGGAAAAAKGGPMGALRGLARDVTMTLLPQHDIRSATRMYTGALWPETNGVYEGTSDLVVLKQRETPWQSAWQSAVHRFPVLNRLSTVKVSNTAAYKKGVEVAEDLRERWETSDHPAVHKVEDVKERLFSGSDASRAMLEIRTRDPAFDINSFARSVKVDGHPVVSAFLRHDMETLKLHCGPELLERFQGIFKHFQEQGLSEDPTIMFTGDVEIVEVRMVDPDPWIIAQFHCQQLKCTRDKFGSVVEGSMDSIQRVYYFWGMQQERAGVVTAEGVVLPPRWVIKDMMWQSMLALV